MLEHIVSRQTVEKLNNYMNGKDLKKIKSSFLANPQKCQKL
jgi:hypothetical protein